MKSIGYKKILFLFLITVIIFFIGIFVYTIISNLKRFEEIKNQNLISNIEQPDNLFLYSYEKQKYDSINIKDKDVFIYLWATWCKPCVEEFDKFDSIFKNKKNNDVFFISNEDTKTINSFLLDKKFNNIPFYSLIKKDSIFKYKILPTTYYSTGNGMMKSKSGKKDWTSFLNKK